MGFCYKQTKPQARVSQMQSVVPTDEREGSGVLSLGDICHSGPHLGFHSCLFPPPLMSRMGVLRAPAERGFLSPGGPLAEWRQPSLSVHPGGLCVSPYLEVNPGARGPLRCMWRAPWFGGSLPVAADEGVDRTLGPAGQEGWEETEFGPAKR